jgi:hypothetical protein
MQASTISKPRIVPTAPLRAKNSGSMMVATGCKIPEPTVDGEKFQLQTDIKKLGSGLRQRASTQVSATTPARSLPPPFSAERALRV